MAGGNGDNYGGLNEADLLAWVEGEALPRDREALLSRVLASQPALARRLHSMRADRALLGDLPEPAAPAGMVEAVEAHLERRMLLGLQQGEPLSDQPPISIVRPARRSRLGSIAGSIFASAAGRRLALAAGLLLLIGGAAYLASYSLSGARIWRPATGSAPIAQGPAVRESVAPIEIATKPPSPGDPSHGADTAPAEIAAATKIAAPQDAAATAPPMTISRAAELARERRLVIRVHSVDPDAAAARIVRDADRVARSSAPWRLSAGAPSDVVAAVAPRESGETLHGPSPLPAAPVRADDAGHDPEEPIVLPVVPPPVYRVPEKPVYFFVLATPADSGMLDRALRMLDGGSGQAAEFVEAADPLPPTPPILTPGAILWWIQPPVAWNAWVAVPVVVEK